MTNIHGCGGLHGSVETSLAFRGQGGHFFFYYLFLIIFSLGVYIVDVSNILLKN
jgi:hypothetical protein